MKKILPVYCLLFALAGNAQKIDSIYVHLYTDSLKKGTYNYINIDGLMSDGHYLPLDSTQLHFSSSYGKFYGNSLFISKDCKAEKVNIKVTMKSNPALQKEFTIYIKKKDDDEHLKTEEEILGEIRGGGKRKKN
ncbi:MAG: hypothetical protein JSU03_10785 [Bacteroidetes bacterium]|nr:hypothetical protein [Bacteroidota bacterium]MBS1757755.1 hypothetical protein [Bacteroidota bacterium]